MSAVFAPANIALIKYMGKMQDAQKTGYFPSNSSISLTLSTLGTWTEVSSKAFRGSVIPLRSGDFWYDSLPKTPQPMSLQPVVLSLNAREKISKHLVRLKEEFQLSQSLHICSANTFPQGVGIASSASGYAALTKAVWEFACSQNPLVPKRSWQNLAELSSLGSGSSGRSWEGPLVTWRVDDPIERVKFERKELPAAWGKLKDCIFLVSKKEKNVSSSEAHLRVLTSPLFIDRPAKAQARLEHLMIAIDQADWKNFCRLSLKDALDMHELFETSEPPFSYRTPKTREIFEFFSSNQEITSVVTLDAGPNVHVIYQEQDEEKFRKILRKNSFLLNNAEVLEDFVYGC